MRNSNLQTKRNHLYAHVREHNQTYIVRINLIKEVLYFFVRAKGLSKLSV